VGGVAVVTDFGVAKAMDLSITDGATPRRLTSLGMALGTPAYMSPEQATADPHVDHRSDIYRSVSRMNCSPARARSPAGRRNSCWRLTCRSPWSRLIDGGRACRRRWQH
jgi:serine/threonine protein kinase